MRRFAWLVFGFGALVSAVGCVHTTEPQEVSASKSPSPNEKELALQGLRADDATARVASVQLVAMGESVIPELRELAKDADPKIQSRARDVLGQITGQWGGGEGIVWRRSVKDAVNASKPLLVLHLFGQFDEENC